MKMRTLLVVVAVAVLHVGVIAQHASDQPNHWKPTSEVCIQAPPLFCSPDAVEVPPGQIVYPQADRQKPDTSYKRSLLRRLFTFHWFHRS